MTPPPRPERSAARRLAAVALLAMLLLVPAAPSLAQATAGDGLEQTLEDLDLARGERVLSAGHVDMGPRFADGEWTFLIHDDAARADSGAASVWRYPDETVLHVLDAGRLEVPEDPAYDFLDAEPGLPVWVVPQTQDPAVVWLGWNTQDPGVLEQVDRGVTLSLTGVRGPGAATVYLQSGSFGEPQVLWDSRNPDAQPAWVDINTHTHANWVFTRPGVYLLRLQADAELIDGTTVSDTQVIRFAVGTETSPADALAAVWDGAVGEEPVVETTEADRTPAEAEPAEDPLVPLLIGAVAVVAGGLVVGVTVVIVHGDRVRRRALRARATAGSASSGGAE